MPDTNTAISQVSITSAHCQTPLGDLQIQASAAGIHAICFSDVNPNRSLAGVRHTELETPALSGAEFALQHISPEPDCATAQILQQAVRQLGEYFAGQRLSFDLPLAGSGTAFQQQVWHQLCAIPFGQTQSYGELALQLGNKNAMRAVGAANGRNPIAIVVPCHRVIGADGKLTGYAGGLDRKIWLLQHEQRIAQAL